MCLAIAMYIITGAISLIRRLLSTIGEFLLTVLAKVILLVDHTMSRGIFRHQTINEIEVLELYTDSEEDRGIMSETFLESKHFPRDSPPYRRITRSQIDPDLDLACLDTLTIFKQ